MFWDWMVAGLHGTEASVYKWMSRDYRTREKRSKTRGDFKYSWFLNKCIFLRSCKTN